jgi:CBS domain-containing protein
MALLRHPGRAQADLLGGVRFARHLEVMTVTATVEEPTTLERQLGTVGAAMTRDVVLLAANMSAEMALRRLDQKAVSGAPVMDHGQVAGVITRRDLLVPTLLDDPSNDQGPGRWTRLTGLKVSDLMSHEPVTAEPNCPVVQAVRTMLHHGVNRLPVVDHAGKPLGVLTRDDVLRVVAGCDQDRQRRSPAPEARP